MALEIIYRLGKVTIIRDGKRINLSEIYLSLPMIQKVINSSDNYDLSTYDDIERFYENLVAEWDKAGGILFTEEALCCLLYGNKQ